MSGRARPVTLNRPPQANAAFPLGQPATCGPQHSPSETAATSPLRALATRSRFRFRRRVGSGSGAPLPRPGSAAGRFSRLFCFDF